MWDTRNGRDRDVTCIACGTELPRSEAREYDREGDRWDRQDKEFEHLCKPCYRDLCHQPRDDLETLLVEIDAGRASRDAFLRRYAETVDEWYGEPEETGDAGNGSERNER